MSPVGPRRTRRLRVAFVDWLPAVAALLLVLAGVGAYLTYTAHVAPGTVTEERTVGEWESTGNFAHRGLVTQQNDVYEPGTVLTEQSFYLTNVVTDLSGEFEYGYDGDGPAELTVDARLELVYREVAPEDGTAYWERREPLSGRTTALEPGETVAFPFYLNATQTGARLAELEGQVGRLPVRSRSEAVVVATTTATDGDQPVETNTYELPVQFRQDVAEVADPGAVVTSHGETILVAVPAEAGPGSAVGGPVALVVGLAGVGVVAWGRHTGRFRVGDGDRERLRFETERARLGEWITVGEIPDHGTAASVATLDGLVGLAADTGERVVEAEGVFAVLHDGVRYEFHAPPVPDRTFGDGSEDPIPAAADGGTDEGEGDTREA